MKKILTAILIFISLQSVAQKTIAPTDSFIVEGAVKQSRSFSLQDLAGLPVTGIDSVVITNHLRERKHAINKVKGVLLKDVLGKITIDQENVKLLSEYYIVCIASDNYKVVFSWNEIFNNETGRHVLVITEQEGKKGLSMDGHIAIVSPTDDATGRRYVKGLQKIIIERVK
jgi:hypothetical protein